MLDPKNVVDCITSLVKHSELCTQDDRNRWILGHEIFSGKYETGGMGESREEEAKVGLHTFSKICRGAASAAQELLHQDPKFYDFIPPDGEEMDLFGKAVEKIHRYRVEELKIENHTYKFVLAGAIAGIGINKLRVVRNLEDDEEFLLNILDEQREKENKALSKDIKTTPVVASPESEPGSQLSLVDQLVESLPKKRKSKKGSKILSHKIKLKIINPVNFFYDPSVESLDESAWFAEKYYLPMHRIEEGFKVGVFTNREELLKILPTGGRTQSTTVGTDLETQKMIYEDKNLQPNEYSPLVEIIEYYGPVLEKGTGKVLAEHQRIFIAGGQVVLSQSPNPDWKRRPPYFFSVTSHVPFKGVGAGIADNGVDQELIGNEIMNLMLEHLAFNVKGVKAVDSSALADTSVLETGFYPGQVVDIRSADGKAVKDLFYDVGYNPNLTFSVIQMLEKLDLSASSAAAVDIQGSNPSSRARISAAEIRSNSDKTSRSQFSLARELDETYLEEMLGRVLDFVLQYDLENQPLQEFLNAGVIAESEFQMIQSIPVNERLREAKRKYRLSVKGFRERLERNEYLSRLVEFMQQTTMMVNTAPELRNSVDFKQLLKLLSEAYGLNSDKVITQNTPYDQAREENALLRIDRQVEVLPNDEHAAHLPMHYDVAMQAQTESVINHIRNHIQLASQGGVPFPPVPPELENLVYGAPQEELGYESDQSGGAVMAPASTFQ